MNGPSFTTNTILRDPFLIKHLKQNQFRENLHKGFLQFTFLIKQAYGPFTPDPVSKDEEEEDQPQSKRKPKRYSKTWVSSSNSGKRPSSLSSKEKHWKAMLLLKHKGADKGKKEKPKDTKHSTKTVKGPKLPNIKKSKHEDVAAGKQRVRYVFRYSESLDRFKLEKYEEVLRTMGVNPICADIKKIDFTDIDDPALLEVNLDWCRVGTFVEDAARPVTSYQSKHDDVTETDKFSVLFGQARAPTRKSVISLVSERSNLGLETPVRQVGSIPRLPPIGEKKSLNLKGMLPRREESFD